MNFQNQFNHFVRTGGTKIVLVRNNGIPSMMSLDNDKGVETGLHLLGHHSVKDIALDKGQLKIYLGNPKGEKHSYHYAYFERDFTFMDIGVSSRKSEDTDF